MSVHFVFFDFTLLDPLGDGLASRKFFCFSHFFSFQLGLQSSSSAFPYVQQGVVFCFAVGYQMWIGLEMGLWCLIMLCSGKRVLSETCQLCGSKTTETFAVFLFVKIPLGSSRGYWSRWPKGIVHIMNIIRYHHSIFSVQSSEDSRIQYWEIIPISPSTNRTEKLSLSLSFSLSMHWSSNSFETLTLGTGFKSRALHVYMEHNGTMFWLRCFQKPFLHLATTKEVQFLRKIHTSFSLQLGVLFQNI